MELDQLTKAIAAAAMAHGMAGQKRRYTGEPYIVHPLGVLALVRTACLYSEEMEIAAVLHDVVEDTVVSLEDVAREFGPVVAFFVASVTNPDKAGKNKRDWKIELCTQLSVAAPEAQTIKVADIIHNCSTIMDHDPAYGRIYIAEKRAVLEACDRADAGLLARARAIVWGLDE